MSTLGRMVRKAAVALMITGVASGSAALVASPAQAIVNGKQTSAYSYPYFVSVHVFKTSGQFKFDTCGGSLIDSQWVLTAAHCMTDGLQGNQVNKVQVLILDKCQVDAVELRVHPLWDGDVTNGHDLALLRIPAGTAHCAGSSPSNQVYPHPVQVGDVSDTGAYAAHVPATVLGHGATYQGGPATTELRYLWTSLRSDSDMSDIYDHTFDSTWNSRLMIGAGDSQHTICKGDSGGPLTVDRSEGTVQVGVVSFGPEDSCDEAGGFARLAGPQQAWIAANVPTANIGACSINGSIPGRWTASYSKTGTGSQVDGGYRYGFTCQRTSSTTSSTPTSAAASAA
jgi:secreted trypsin-like serine protease